MKKRFYLTKLFIFVLLPSLSAAQLRFSAGQWDAGRVDPSKTVRKSGIYITNNSDRPVFLDIRVSCNCITAVPSSDLIMAGGKTDLDIIFDPSSYAGQDVKFTVFAADYDNPSQTAVLEITASVSGKRSSKPAPSAAAAGSVPKSVEVLYFYSIECAECRKIKDVLIPGIEKDTGIGVGLKEYDVTEPENFELMLLAQEKLGQRSKLMPVMVIGSNILAGEKQIWRELKEEVKKYPEGIAAPVFRGNKGRAGIIEGLGKAGLIPILFAGLLDGINPCAFATIIFLISYLSLLKLSPRAIFLTGLSFTVSVFITYFLIGFGIFRFLVSLKGFSVVSRIINYVIAGMAFVFAFLSLYDYYMAKKGDIGAMKLQLPEFLKSRIHKVVREKTRSGGFILPAFVMGFLVSIFELACTGQVYLPTIIYVSRVRPFLGVLYLSLYNLMFILPLVIVFIVFYFGVKAEVLGRVLKSGIPAVKFGTAILFFLLGGLILLINL